MPMSKSDQDAWLDHHTTVNHRSDWPTDRAFWDVWRTRITKLNCDLATACQASSRVAESPPSYLDRHLDAVSDAVKAIYRERQSRSGSPDVLRERAERGDELNPGEVAEITRMSAGCPSCEGNGTAVRHGSVHPEKKTSVHCRCVIGRWIRERCRKTAPDVFRRVPCLVENPWLDGEEYGGPGAPFEPVAVGVYDEHEPAY